MKEHSFFEKNKMPFKITIFVATSIVTLFFIKVLGIHGEGMVRSQYGPYGIWSTYLTIIDGIIATIAVLSLFNILEQIGIGIIGRSLSMIGQNTAEIYLWQFFGLFIMEVLYFTISKNIYLNQYWMKLLPPSATWYVLVETIVVIDRIILIKMWL